MAFKSDNTNKWVRASILLAAIAGGVMALAPVVVAGQASIYGTGIRGITPMTETSSHLTQANAADHFDIVGILNRINGNQVTIGDRKLTLAPGVGTYGLKQYTIVGANLNRTGGVVALELVSDEPN